MKRADRRRRTALAKLRNQVATRHLVAANGKIVPTREPRTHKRRPTRQERIYSLDSEINDYYYGELKPSDLFWSHDDLYGWDDQYYWDDWDDWDDLYDLGLESDFEEYPFLETEDEDFFYYGGIRYEGPKPRGLT